MIAYRGVVGGHLDNHLPPRLLWPRASFLTTCYLVDSRLMIDIDVLSLQLFNPHLNDPFSSYGLRSLFGVFA